MTDATILLSSALALPGVLLLLCLFPSVRAQMPKFAVIAPVPALAAACFAGRDPSAVFAAHFFQVDLALDIAGTLLLSAAAILWICAGLYAATEMRSSMNAGNFSAWWLTAMLGNFGIVMSADIASFYLFLAIGTIGAYGMIMHTMKPDARRASVTYIGFALAGEASILPWRDLTVAFLALGFGLKIGLAPLHIWMPLAYTAAPIPAAAVLSGAAVKAGVIGLIRFMPFDAGSVNVGTCLAMVGIVSTFYGVAVGITRANPKTILAYSSISQMGVIATLIGTGLATANAGVAIAAAFYGAHHVLVKGGLFLAAGIGVSDRRNGWLVFVPAAVLAFALAGLPFTGGYLAKEAVKPFIGEGAFAIFAALSAAGTTLLMLFFVTRLGNAPHDPRGTPTASGLLVPWLATAFFAIAIPWLSLSLTDAIPISDVNSIADLWSAIWPILIGSGLVALWLNQKRQPREIDVASAADIFRRVMTICASTVERAEAILRQWQAGSISLLAVTTVLIVIIATGR